MTDNKPIEPYASMLALAQARQDLRRDLVRWLAYPPNPRPIADIPDLDAHWLLELCVHYRVVFAGDEPNLPSTWDKRRSSKGSPTFKALVGKGWVIFDGCRWAFPPLPIRGASDVVYPNDETRDFLRSLGRASLQAGHRGSSPTADALAQEFKVGKRDLGSMGWRIDADWIVARLWQRLCPPAGAGEADVDEAFADWCAWCLVLNVVGKWDLGWRDEQALHCRDAAWRVLDRQTQWGLWGDDSERYVRVLTKTLGIQSAYVPHPSREDADTLVERVQSLRDPALRHLIDARLRSSAAGFALGVLYSELERTDMSQGLLTSATKLVSFVTSRPMAFVEVVSRLTQQPELLADMLMQPAAAGAATMLITEWLPSTNAWNRALSSQREDMVKRFAVQDALAVLAHHLKSNRKELQELAALVTWCYAEALGVGPAANAAVRRSVGRQLVVTVGVQPQEVQIEFLRHLVAQAPMKRNVRFALFGGVLDALACLPAARPDIANALIPLYTAFAQATELSRTDVAQLPSATIASLLALALRQDSVVQTQFLYPVDLAAQLKRAKVKDRPTVLMGFSDMLRTHVRMLARAIAGWRGDSIPDALAEALRKWVWQTCVDRPKKARVGALTSRYSSTRFFTSEVGSPAADLAAAWRRLDSRWQDELLRVLVDADDPVLLADLCRHLPSAAGTLLRARLVLLTPASVAKPLSWLELEQRAAALIEAGELGVAEVFLKEATTGDEHAPEAIRLKTFGLGLQLLIKKKAWTDIDVATVPNNFSNLLKERAAEFLTFYRATSQMLRPNGNLKAAKHALATLAKKANSALTYRENFYAAAIQELIGPEMRGLPEAEREDGARILAEIDADIASIGPDLSRTHVLAEHRALLLIAMERPQEAIDTLAPYRTGRGTKQTELFAAMARASMGFEDQAATILDEALQEFGPDPVLLDARQGLRVRTRAAVTPAASLVVDHVTAAKAAVQALARLQPDELGEVLGPTGQGMRGYLTDLVSRSVAGLQHVAPILRGRGNSKVYMKMEDDLNTAVREILNAYLKFVTWHVNDQSLGGQTGAGNPGKRDAVICSGGMEISIYEALVCGGVNRSNTVKHFHKLLGYGTVDIYFLVIYSFAADIEPLLDSVEDIAQNSLPSHTVLDTIKRLGPPNQATRGFLANYKIAKRDAAVVFLIADLEQGVGYPITCESEHICCDCGSHNVRRAESQADQKKTPRNAKLRGACLVTRDASRRHCTLSSVSQTESVPARPVQRISRRRSACRSARLGSPKPRRGCQVFRKTF